MRPAGVADAKKKKGPKITSKVYFDITIGGEPAARKSTARVRKRLLPVVRDDAMLTAVVTRACLGGAWSVVPCRGRSRKRTRELSQSQDVVN